MDDCRHCCTWWEGREGEGSEGMGWEWGITKARLTRRKRPNYHTEGPGTWHLPHFNYPSFLRHSWRPWPIARWNNSQSHRVNEVSQTRRRCRLADEYDGGNLFGLWSAQGLPLQNYLKLHIRIPQSHRAFISFRHYAQSQPAICRRKSM